MPTTATKLGVFLGEELKSGFVLDEAALQHPPMQGKKEIEGLGLSRLKVYNWQENRYFQALGKLLKIGNNFGKQWAGLFLLNIM